jgi:hypothetical protein
MKPTRTAIALWTLFPLAALLAGCRSEGLGAAPESLVELYDITAPGGGMEIELQRDGAILEMEADVAISDLPAAVLEAALAQAPGALITGAEREVHPDGRMWEVKLWHGGREWELVVDDDGRVHETEMMLHRFEWPGAIVAAADAAVPGGYTKSVEVLEHRKHGTSYHVKKDVHGASYKIVVGPDGMVRRKVREQAAEIEIPLN